MKKRIFFYFIMLLLSTLSVFIVTAQDFGLAVQDQLRAPLTNPAAMGVGNSAGAAYIQNFDDEGLVKDYDLLFSLGGLAYAYQRNLDQSEHLLAAGTEVGQGFYSGASYSWGGEGNMDSSLGLSLLYRPLPSLSLALKGEDLTGSTYSELGIGIRPLVRSKGRQSRLTFSGDARLDKDGFEGISLGAFLEPLDGVKIFGDYNFQTDEVELGISVAHSFIEAGISQQASEERTFERGQYHIYTSFKKQRSVLETGFRKAVEYDKARIITDSPHRGFGFLPSEKGSGSLMDFIQDMEKIKSDKSIDVLIFRNQEFQTSFANILEIETLLKELKASGKKIYFYYDSIGPMPYALAASVGDEIYLSPAGNVDLRGFSASKIYLKDFLADWGIRVQNFQSHPYKTAFNGFSESQMTDEERESLEYLYGGLHSEMLRMLDSGRSEKFSRSAKETLDSGPFISGRMALETGVVDDLLYEDEFNAQLKKDRLTRLPYSMISGGMTYQWNEAVKPVIAVIYANGNILSGTGIAGQTIGSDSLSEAIRRARNNPLVKAIILRINSGGGSALASDLISREVALCRSGDHPKPLIVSMGGMAASGGYYIAAPAEKIVASPGSITGSIGVIAIFPELSALLEKYRIQTETIRTSEGADTGSPLRSLTGEEEEKISTFIADSYDQFISLVAEYREMTKEEVNEQARGRVWTGSQALERGLVDETGGLNRAIELTKELISARDGIRIIEMIPGRKLSILERAIPSSQALLPEDLANLVQFYQELSRFEKGKALYLMPYTGEELGVSP